MPEDHSPFQDPAATSTLAPMRIAILGPAHGNVPALSEIAQILLDEIRAEKVIYLGDDDALDRLLAAWTEEISGPGALSSVFDRAAERCAAAESSVIEAFVGAERARLRLKAFVGLQRGQRLIELVGGRVAMFVMDKNMFDDRDMSGATLFVFGNNDESLIMRLGARTFLAPGPVGSLTGGAAILDASAEGVRIEIMNSAGMITSRELISSPQAAQPWSHGDAST